MRKNLLFGMLFFQFFSASAQWSKCTLPAGVYPFSLAIHADTIYLGTLSNGMYRSVNGGSGWTEINSGIVNKQIWTVYCTGNQIFAAAANGYIYRSSNGGDSWVTANSGISSTTIIKSFAAFDGKLFAASTNKGVYISADNGTTWTQHNSGITGLVASALLVAESDLFVSVLQLVYKYDRTAQTWTSKSNGIPNNTVTCLTGLKDNSQNLKLFACSGNSKDVVRSENKGDNWVMANNGLPNVGVVSLTAVGTSVFAGNDYGVYQTTDLGNNWTDVSTGFQIASQASFITSGSTDLYVIQGAALWKRSLSAFGITGLNNRLKEQKLTFFPNPAKDVIHIETTEPIVKTEIYSISGDLIDQNQTGATKQDINSLKAGMYFLKVYGASTISIGTFIKR